MHRAILKLLPIAVLLFVSSISSAADAPWTGGTLASSLLAVDGPLQKVQEPLAQIFQFKIEAGQLKIDRAGWGHAVVQNEKKHATDLDAALTAAAGNPASVTKLQIRQQEQAARDKQRRDRLIARIGSIPPLYDLFHQLQSLASAGSRSSGSSDIQRPVQNGSKQWIFEFHCDALTGALQIDSTSEELEFRELVAPNRTLTYRSGNDTGLSLSIEHPGGETLRLQQNPKGECTVVINSGDKAREAHANSFVEFAKQHRDVLDSEVLPVLAKFDICPLAPVNSPEVRGAVLASLMDVSATREEATRTFMRLDDDNFEVREKATKTLTDNYPMFKYLITEKLNDRQIPLEVQARLQRIVAGRPTSTLPVQTATALDLANDPAYIVSLLDDGPDGSRPQLTKHLEKLTGEKLGDDVAAWKEWAAKQR